ncbi:MAG TPA: hypothetical protein VIX41_08910 [Acidimicrobiales bacterium]
MRAKQLPANLTPIEVLELINQIYDDDRWPRYTDVLDAMLGNQLEARRAVKILTEAGHIVHCPNGVLIPVGPRSA